MRPESILWFERVYIGRIVIGLALSIYTFYWMRSSFGYWPPVSTAIGLMSIGGVVLGVLINLLLLYFIARRASTVAKWIFVALAVLMVVPVLYRVIAPNFLPAALKMGPLFGAGLDFTMIMLLFQPDSRQWFERRGVVEEDYADTFS